VEPYWEIARITGYGRALDLSARELYGVERIDGGSIEKLQERFRQSLAPGHYQRVLKEKSRIAVCLLDKEEQLDATRENLGADPRFFRPVFRLDRFVNPKSFDTLRGIERELDRSICSFSDWQEACQSTLDRAFSRGAVALKTGLAYDRTLLFERAAAADAEAAFNEMLQNRRIPDWEQSPVSPGKALQDYMMHFILRLANARGLVFQVHTGLQEGSGNIISNAHPVLLSNLFLEYPRVRFVLMHIGYPYQHTLSALAKNFPNVFIDMCWAHVISPAASRAALDEWLDSVPCNKICAFGGDYALVDGIFGHQYLARLDVSRVLAAKVDSGDLAPRKAKEIAGMLFYSNPEEIFRLSGRL
jgi:hypothetical protein